MAALSRAPSLPLPAPATALIAALYTDTEGDPTREEWGFTMTTFYVDSHNATANIPTNDLRQMTTSPTSTSENPAGYIIISGGVRRMYTTITTG